MKKSKLTKLLVLALVAVIAVGIGMSAMADEAADVVYDHTGGVDGKPVITLSESLDVADYKKDEHTHTLRNLFKNMEGMMPGDSRTSEFTVKAQNLDSNDQVEILLMTEAQHDGITDAEKNFFAKYVDVLVERYDAETSEWVKAGAAEDGTNGTYGTATEETVPVCKLGNNETAKFRATVTLDIDTPSSEIIDGNEVRYDNTTAAIGWVFAAGHVDVPNGGGGGEIPDPVIPSDPFITDHYAYVIGRDDGLVHPEANITRAEVATIFFRMFTDEVRTQFWKQTNPFDDVFSTNWYNNAISTMYNAGVVTGYPDGSFKPDGSITRAEFAAMLSRFFDTEYEGEDLFSDIDGHWAADLINNAAQNGLIEGYPDGTYRPDNYITRAEAMTGINRILGRAPNKDHLLSNMITWPDNMDTEKWYYAAVQEATNSHDYDMQGDGTEKWTKLLDVRDWAALEREWSEANSAKNPGNVVKSSDK